MPSQRVRQHVNPLRSEYFRIPLEPLALAPDVPVEVELGSAEAWFLMDRAVEEPDGQYIGLELRHLMVKRANNETARRGLTNVRSVFANISRDLPRLFAPERVRRFHLYFPDPWWKSRQQKRRVAEEGLVHDMIATLQSGGEINVATDIFEIALEMMALLEAEAPHRLVNAAGAWSFMKAPPFSARSRRERQCEDEKTKIWRLLYRKP